MRYISLIIVFGLVACQTVNSGGIAPGARVLENRPYEIIGKSGSEASNFALFNLFTITEYEQTQNAIDDAIAEKNGDALIDVTYTIERHYWIIGTVRLLRLEGTVIRYR